jgi:hypothetical protein
MILIQKILFTNDECKLIQNCYKNNKQVWNYLDRNYESESIQYTEETKWIFDKLKYFFESETKIKITNLKKVIHFHKFTNGDRFERHTDIRDNRVYSIGVLLNDNFEGGDFKLYNSDEYTINKKTGNTYIFDSSLEHEITPILSNKRYSLIWFLQNENIKLETNKLI